MTVNNPKLNDPKLQSPPPGTWGVATEMYGKLYGVASDWNDEDCCIFSFQNGDWKKLEFKVWNFGGDMYNALEMIILWDHFYTFDKTVLRDIRDAVGRCEFVSSFLKNPDSQENE